MVAVAEAFVGRRPELEALRGALDHATIGKGRLVLISGEPGIGKTRTALELNAHVAQCGAQIWWGRCHEEAGAPPYWPWAQIVQAVVAASDVDALRLDLEAGAADIAGLTPTIRDRLPNLDTPPTLSDPTETRFRLFGSIARFLTNLSRRRPQVLVFDDLHWADIPSLRLLEFLSHDIQDTRLLIVGTYRETELSRRHHLSHTLGALARVPFVVRLQLQRLSADDVRQFVTMTAGALPPVWLTSAIHDQTEGNPLFVREVVQFLAQQGYFSGAVALPASIRLPEGVREVIGRRLNLLSIPCNEILSLGAVIGREFSRDVLVKASSDRPELIVLDALDEARAVHLIEETTPGTYQFTHALVRVTLYDELRTSQRRRLHRVVREAIETVHRRDPSSVLAELAHHFGMAGFSDDLERAIDYATRAGQSADVALAYEDAIGLFQNALDMVDALNADDPARRCILMLRLGDAQRKANDFPTALETLRLAADIARTQQMAVTLGEAAYLFADTAWRHDQQANERSGPLLELALGELPEPEAALRVKLMGSLARDRLHTGNTEGAKALARQAIAMARTLGDPSTLATSLAGLVDAPWKRDETAQMLADATEMAEMAESANDLELAVRGHFRRVSLMLELGDIQAAMHAIEMMSRINTRVRQPIFTLFELGLKATMALMRGALDEAERHILQSGKTQPFNRTHVVDPVSMLIFTLRRGQGRSSIATGRDVAVS